MVCIVVATLWATISVSGQPLLNRVVTVQAREKPVRLVLNQIAKQGKFAFSYGSNIIGYDSIVSINASNVTVKAALDMLFKGTCQYRETESHIIILPAETEKYYTISGYVTDAITGEALADASVIDRAVLASTLTGPNGYYRLRVKEKNRLAMTEITISKGFYTDTTIVVPQGIDQELSLSIQPAAHTLPDVVINQYSRYEHTWLGRVLLSSSLRKQSANLTRFFVDKPFQVSLLPGIGTHGKLSSQVTNKFSFSMLGGYTAGTEGFELGGLFNIDKKDVAYAQIGGLANFVHGGARGVQIAGMVNTVDKSVNGVQVSGIYSQVMQNIRGCSVTGIAGITNGNVTGVQIAGIVNFVGNKDSVEISSDDTLHIMRGLQVAGITNIVNNRSEGMQLAGIANISRRGIKGLQLSGFCNLAGKVEGSQIGFVNIADTVSGYTIGLLNLNKRGLHALDLSTNEYMNINVAFKSGNEKMYSIISAGYNTVPGKKVVGWGLGFGFEGRIWKKLGCNTELMYMYLHRGDSLHQPSVVKLAPSFILHIKRRLAVYAGPSFSLNTEVSEEKGDEYLYGVPEKAFYSNTTIKPIAVWMGWQVGIRIF